MSRIKFIEMPREEIRLDALEQSMIGAGGDCVELRVCEGERKTSTCETYESGPCSGGKGSCGGSLYCSPFTCDGKYAF